MRETVLESRVKWGFVFDPLERHSSSWGVCSLELNLGPVDAQLEETLRIKAWEETLRKSQLSHPGPA
jgi:hypothetical protein